MRIRFAVIGVLVGFTVVSGSLLGAVVRAQEAKPPQCGIGSECLAKQITDGLEAFADIPPTEFAYVPPAPVATKPPTAGQTKVTYTVQTRGVITANLAEFKALANETMNSSLGWARMGVSFSEVASSGSFILVLSEASQVPSFGPPCDSTYSCRVGNYVIINQDRWLTATPSWNSAGGSLRDYRNMVVNHETGHWLGHRHEYCSAAGNKAPVMQQQSISLQGCAFNPWPLESELWSTRLGI